MTAEEKKKWHVVQKGKVTTKQSEGRAGAKVKRWRDWDEKM